MSAKIKVAVSPAWILLTLLFLRPAIAVPEIQNWKTGQGVQVLFVESHSLPMVDIRVVFSAGSARDGDKPGLALLTNSVITSGAGNMDADQIAAKLEDIGAQLSNESYRDMALVSLRSLSEPDKLKRALTIMRQVVGSPTFPAKALARDQRRLLAVIAQKQQQPDSVASDAFYAAIYGEHPYAHPPEGTAASVQSVTREDLLAFHKRYYVPANAVVAVVGDLSRTAAEAYVDELLQGLPQGDKPAPIPAVPALSEAKEIRLPMKTSQTHILLGQPGMRRGDKDYFSLYVGNHVLGGSGFASRLMQSIREDRGLVYDVHSYFLPMDVRGPFIAGMQTRNEQAEEALKLLRQEIRRFVEQGPTRKELDKAIQNITGGFPLNIDSNQELVNYLAMIAFYRLPLDYLDKFNANIKAVTVEAVKDAFRRRVHPESLVSVIVGGAVEQPAK
jgi:zinc protease